MHDVVTGHVLHNALLGGVFNKISSVYFKIIFKIKLNKIMTRMWANAQRDGRPAECRWCPLFNAAKFG